MMPGGMQPAGMAMQPAGMPGAMPGAPGGMQPAMPGAVPQGMPVSMPGQQMAGGFPGASGGFPTGAPGGFPVGAPGQMPGNPTGPNSGAKPQPCRNYIMGKCQNPQCPHPHQFDHLNEFTPAIRFALQGNAELATIVSERAVALTTD